MKEVVSTFLPNNFYQLAGFLGFVAGGVYGFIQGIIYVTRAYTEVRITLKAQDKLDMEKAIALADLLHETSRKVDMMEHTIMELLTKDKDRARENKTAAALIGSLRDSLTSFQQNFTMFLKKE